MFSGNGVRAEFAAALEDADSDCGIIVSVNGASFSGSETRPGLAFARCLGRFILRPLISTP